jgi:predicted helicase
VDGGMNASQKEEKLDWLKAETPANTCRILSNVRCLSEGVDVPALDAVLFLTPRNSQVDVVQSVGRVMRNAPGKKRGYVILPVVIPAGVEPHEALNDNKTYKVVWQVLQALRSHDDRFDAMVNKLDLIGRDKSQDGSHRHHRQDPEKAEQSPRLARKKVPTGKARAAPSANPKASTGPSRRAGFAIRSRRNRARHLRQVVQKCGNRHHWEDWANDIAKIARTHIDRITGILENPANQERRKPSRLCRMNCATT